MSKLASINEFVIKFANVNGSGSASANQMFAKGIFRSGIPVSPKNIFPSNIQGLPTWFEIRASEKGYLGRKAGIDFMVAMNPQSYIQDVAEINPGGYLLYDSSWKREFHREDINIIEVPLTSLCVDEFQNPKTNSKTLKNSPSCISGRLMIARLPFIWFWLNSKLEFINFTFV